MKAMIKTLAGDLLLGPDKRQGPTDRCPRLQTVPWPRPSRGFYRPLTSDCVRTGAAWHRDPDEPRWALSAPCLHGPAGAHPHPHGDTGLSLRVRVRSADGLASAVAGLGLAGQLGGGAVHDLAVHPCLHVFLCLHAAELLCHCCSPLCAGMLIS